MNLGLFNDLLNNVKENNVVQNFMEELANYLEKVNNKTNCSGLRQENCLYQVVQIVVDGAYLQNMTNNRIEKETDISKEVLSEIGNDSILRFKDGKYIYEEDLTRKIL